MKNEDKLSLAQEVLKENVLVSRKMERLDYMYIIYYLNEYNVIYQI